MLTGDGDTAETETSLDVKDIFDDV